VATPPFLAYGLGARGQAPLRVTTGVNSAIACRKGKRSETYGTNMISSRNPSVPLPLRLSKPFSPRRPPVLRYKKAGGLYQIDFVRLNISAQRMRHHGHWRKSRRSLSPQSESLTVRYIQGAMKTYSRPQTDPCGILPSG